MDDTKNYIGGVDTVERSTLKQKIILFALVISTIAAYIETDIYVPSFPDMLAHFATTEATLQLIVSGNFLGIFLGCLVYGPLADCYGRRRILLIGTIIFVISSVGCMLSQTIYQLIGWRFIQGAGSASAMCIAFTILIDIYPPKKAVKLFPVLGSFITSTLAFAPATGSWLNWTFGWRANFVLIAIIAFVSLVLIFVFVDETLTEDKKHEFDLTQIMKNYYDIATTPLFFLNGIISSLMYAAFLIYLSNLSLIFINHLHIDEKIYVYYQSSTMGLFVIFSLLSVKIISWLGEEKAKIVGSIMAVIGAIALMWTALFMSNSPIMISVSFGIVTAGCATCINIYFLKAMALFPSMNGMASSTIMSIRQITTASIILIFSLFFNGTIMPIAVATVMLTVICIWAYFKIQRIVII